MKKLTLVFICIFIFMLAGCQVQLDPSNSKVDSSQTTPDSASDPGSTSEGDSMNTDAGTDQADEKDDARTDNPSEDDPINTPAWPDEIGGDVNSIEIGNDDLGWATVISTTGKHELKSEGSLHGEIEVTHKLSIGKKELLEGETVLFHIETKSAGAELKITLTGSGTGTTLEGGVMGSGDISFEIDTSDEYTVMLENCSLRGVQFTIDYSIGGSK